MSELIVDLRGETDESRRRRQRGRAVGFVILVAALYVLFSDEAAGPVETPAGAIVSIDPDLVDFDARPVGDIATREIRVRNSGTSAVLVSRIANATGAQSDFAIVSSTCKTITPQRDCVVTVQFKPSREGPQETSFTVLDGEGNSIGTIDVRGTGTKVAAVLELTAPEFPDVLIGQSSEAGSILVRHRGGAPVRILSVAPNDAVGFAVENDNCSGTLLQASANCTVDIVFKPLTRGVVTGSWTITDEEAAHEVRVTARALARHLSLVPDALNFPPIQMGFEPATGQLSAGAGAEQTFTVTNDGDVPVVIEKVGADAPFIVRGTSCAGPLAPSDPCQVTIVFRPRTVGEASGRVVIQGTGGTEEAALTARGVVLERQVPRIGRLIADPAGSIQMTNYNEERPITITNIGNAPVTMTRVLGPTGWLKVNDQCSGRTLRPRDQCVVTLIVATDDYHVSRQYLIFNTTGTAAPNFQIEILAPGSAANVTP